MASLPKHLHRAHVLEAIKDFRAGATQGFAPSAKLDLVYEGQRFPPRAIFGLAIRRATGIDPRDPPQDVPQDLSASDAASCVRALRACGFPVVPKHYDALRAASSGMHGRGKRSWSAAEYQAAVASYVELLLRELSGERASRKTVRDRWLAAPYGRWRSDAEYAREYQELGAALAARGLPYLDGYEPLASYSAIADAYLDEHLTEHPEALQALLQIADAPLAPKDEDDAAAKHKKGMRPAASLLRPVLKEEPPPFSARTRELAAPPRRSAVHIDYAEREAKNRALGKLGEELVLLYEHQRLCQAGRADLAAAIRHVSVLDGDGLGYDIRSYEVSGAPLHIEVKATRSGRAQAFFLSENELAFSAENPESFRLYRVYRIATRPRLYVLAGSLRTLAAAGAICLRPRSYVALV